jgi:hypothetical protein
VSLIVIAIEMISDKILHVKVMSSTLLY